MGIMVWSLLWVMQEYVHQPHGHLGLGFGVYVGFTKIRFRKVSGVRGRIPLKGITVLQIKALGFEGFGIRF